MNITLHSPSAVPIEKSGSCPSASMEDQQPWFESSLVGDFYFVPPDGVQGLARKAPATGAARPAQPALAYRKLPGSIGHEGESAWYRTNHPVAGATRADGYAR
jgi:hypothetical protein